MLKVGLSEPLLDKTIAATKPNEPNVAEVAKQFESILLNQLTSGLRSQVNEDGEDETGSSNSLDLPQQLIAEQIADVIAKNGGIGLANAVMEQLNRYKQTTEKPTSNKNSIELDAANITRPRQISKLVSSAKVVEKEPLTTRPRQVSLETNKVENFQKIDSHKINHNTSFTNKISKLDSIIADASKKYSVDPHLIKAVIQQESNAKQFAVSSRGASGYMQLLPSTFRQFGGAGKSIFDAKENIFAGTAYLRFLSDKYSGNIDKILAAYNAGPGNVNKYGGIPPFSETTKFVATVKDNYAKFSALEPKEHLPNVNEQANLIAKNQIDKSKVSSANNIAQVSNKTLGTNQAENKALQLPINGRISSNFGAARKTHNHKGIDIAAKKGTEVKAAANGKVLFAGWQKGYGRTVVVQHEDGKQTRYAHAENLLVAKGDDVLAGQKIATVGSTGHSTGPHLHFEVLEQGKAINPLSVTQHKTTQDNDENKTQLFVASIMPRF